MAVQRWEVTVRRVLIKGGHVLSMDPAVGDLPGGDLLVEGSAITAIAPDLSAGDAEVIDATGMIVMPGMVDGHKHTWQTIFRGTSGDETLWQFFGEAVPATAPLMTPDDVYASNLLGAIDALDAGVTTFVDWCHITLSPEHTRAAVRGVKESGARVWFAHGAPQPTWGDKTLEHPADLEALQGEEFASDDELVRLAMAARGPMFADLDVTQRDFAFARRLGIPISVHVDMPGYDGLDIVRLNELGALGDDLCFLHGNTLTDEEIDLAIGAGATFVDSAPLDVLMGIGQANTERLLAKGVRPGISPDTTVANPTDLFWVMRAIVLLERARAFGPTFRSGAQPPKSHLTARQMLDLATQAGAEAVWLGDRVGSLSPGKDADIVLVRASDLNMQPLNDVTTALVYGADRGNVDTVLVAGRVVKRSGRIVSVDQDAVVRRAVAARDRIYDEAARRGYVPAWRSSSNAIGVG
jgi:5-methylthioadenosine/S-adenosylhomocysteine deaminase